MQSVESLNEYWSSPAINWFDYFVDRKRFELLLAEPTVNKDMIGKLAIQFTDQATTVLRECEVLTAKAFPREDIEFSQRKAACLWLCAVSCLTALQWDFDYLLDTADILSVGPLLDYIQRMYKNREITTDSSFGDWLFARWVLSIDRRYRMAPAPAKQSVNNPLLVADLNFTRQDSVRKAVIETRTGLAAAVQSLEKFVVSPKAMYIPGVGCFLQPFLEVGGMAMSIGIVGDNVLVEGAPKPNLTTECSLLSAKDVISKTRYDLVSFYFAENNLLQVKEHLLQITSTSGEHCLIRIDTQEVAAYCTALRLTSPFPIAGTSSSFQPDQKMLTDDTSVNRRLRTKRLRAEKETNGQLQVAFRAENIARDLIDGVSLTLRHKLGDAVVNTSFAKSVVRQSARLSKADRMRVRGHINYLCATVQGLRDEMIRNKFDEGELTLNLAQPSVGVSSPLSTTAVKGLLQSENPMWTVLTSFDVREIKDALAKVQLFTLPHTFRLPELLGDYVLVTRPIVDFHAVLLGKLEQMCRLGNAAEWKELCNNVAPELGQLANQNAKRLILEAVHVQSMSMNDRLHYSWELSKVAQQRTLVITATKLFLQAETVNIPHSAQLAKQALALFLNSKEWDFVLNRMVTQSSLLTLARLMAAVAEHSTTTPASLRRLADAFVNQASQIFELPGHKKRGSRDARDAANRENTRLRIELTHFLKLIKEPTLLPFLISFFAYMFNRALLADKKPQLRIFVQNSELFSNESDLSHGNIEAIEECLQIVLRNGLRVNPMNAFWLRTMADYKYAKGETDEAVALYMEAIVACRPTLLPPFPDNVVDDTVWLRLRVCLTRVRCHTLALLVCQMLRSKREEHYVKNIEPLTTQCSLDAGAECSSMVWDVSLMEYMAQAYSESQQLNWLDRLLWWTSKPALNMCNRPELLSKEFGRRTEHLMRVLAAHAFAVQL